MKSFYMVPYSTVLGAIEKNNLTGKRNFQFYYDTPENVQPDTKVLVCLEARDDGDEAVFSGLPGVEVLGDPLSRSAAQTVIKTEHIQALSHVGVKQGDSLVELAVAAGKMHPIMRVRGI